MYSIISHYFRYLTLHTYCHRTHLNSLFHIETCKTMPITFISRHLMNNIAIYIVLVIFYFYFVLKYFNMHVYYVSNTLFIFCTRYTITNKCESQTFE